MTSQQYVSAVSSLVRAVQDLLAGHSFQHHARLLGAFYDGSIVPPAGDPIDLRVLGVLPAASAVAASQADANLAEPVQLLSLSAPWRQTAAYVRDPPDDRFLDGYAHATLAGRPDAEHRSVDCGLSVGLLLLGGGVHYPPHQHPADEVYVPLGTATWLDSTDGTYRARPAGVPVHHRPWQPHAVRTGIQPLLAVYLWSGDVTTPSRWCGPDPTSSVDRD